MLNEADVNKDTRKIVMMGSPKSGKSTLLSVLTKDVFISAHAETPGMEFASRVLTADGKPVPVQTWDAPGNLMTGTLSHLAPSYFRGATAVIFVYDVTDRASFDNLQALWDLAQPHLAALGTPGKDYVTILIGNKIDLTEARVVTAEEATQFAEGKFTLVQEVTAKNSISVNKVFSEVAKITPVLKKLSVTHQEESAAPTTSTFDGKLQALINELNRKKACSCFVNKDKKAEQIHGIEALKAALLVPGANPTKAVDDAETNYPSIKHNRAAAKLLKQIVASAPAVEEQRQSTSEQVL